jgi:serine/threonine protein kinase
MVPCVTRKMRYDEIGASAPVKSPDCALLVHLRTLASPMQMGDLMDSSSLEPGFRLGKYQVVVHLATGGMGAVYKAVDRKTRRVVALKVLPAHLAANDLAMERFRREARSAARLNHPNIVSLYEYNHDKVHDVHYLALEFIDGIDLANHIAQLGRLSPTEARRILIQAAKALGHAFEHGVVHRDIKPSNIMLARTGKKMTVKLTDLGLAITQGADDFRVTREGNTVGTIDYIAPEQARDSQAVDIRSDIYSLGCTAYHMLAGKAPFAEGGLGERLFKHLEMPPTDVRQFNGEVSAGFWRIIATMLAKKPDERFATPNDLLDALKQTPAEATEAEAPLSSSRRRTLHGSTVPTSLFVSPGPAKPTPDDTPTVTTRAQAPQVSPEQARTAAAFHVRAVQVLAQGGGEPYARQLLDDCLKLDPFSTACRHTLRELNRKAAEGTLSRWFGALNVFAIKSKLRVARYTGDWRKVFEHGEQLLAYHPADADTHIELAETATEIGLPQLARWFLEYGRALAPDNGQLLRAQARLHEHCQEWKAAVALWQRVIELEPANGEARRKITELCARDLLASGHYRY